VGKCNKTADEWRLTKLNNTVNNTSMWAIVLGENNEFIACWDTGDGVQDPHKKKQHQMLKKPFPEGKLPSMECGWRKAGPKRFHEPRFHYHRWGYEKGDYYAFKLQLNRKYLCKKAVPSIQIRVTLSLEI